ncbi:hypothetical protein F4780DRAFT_766581, partial [Xylariomycetidae sp. FL0641]
MSVSVQRCRAGNGPRPRPRPRILALVGVGVDVGVVGLGVLVVVAAAVVAVGAGLEDAAEDDAGLAVGGAELVDLGEDVLLGGLEVGDGDEGGLGGADLVAQLVDGAHEPEQGGVGLVGQDGVAGAQGGVDGHDAVHLQHRQHGAVGHLRRLHQQHVGRALPQVLAPPRHPEHALQLAAAHQREAVHVLAVLQAVEQGLDAGGVVAGAALPGLHVVADVLELDVGVRVGAQQVLEDGLDGLAGDGALLDQAALVVGHLAVLDVLAGAGRGRVVVGRDADAEVAAVVPDVDGGGEGAVRLLGRRPLRPHRRLGGEGARLGAPHQVPRPLPRPLRLRLRVRHDRVPLARRVRLDRPLALGPRRPHAFLGRCQRHGGSMRVNV